MREREKENQGEETCGHPSRASDLEVRPDCFQDVECVWCLFSWISFKNWLAVLPCSCQIRRKKKKTAVEVCALCFVLGFFLQRNSGFNIPLKTERSILEHKAFVFWWHTMTTIKALPSPHLSENVLRYYLKNVLQDFTINTEHPQL